MNEFLNGHGLSHTGTSEETNLPSLNEGNDEVDGLDTRFKDFGLCGLLSERWWLAVDGKRWRSRSHRTLSVDRLTQNIEDAAQGGFSNRNRNRSTGSNSL